VIPLRIESIRFRNWNARLGADVLVAGVLVLSLLAGMLWAHLRRSPAEPRAAVLVTGKRSMKLYFGWGMIAFWPFFVASSAKIAGFSGRDFIAAPPNLGKLRASSHLASAR
jgi:hypothetical protein